MLSERFPHGVTERSQSPPWAKAAAGMLPRFKCTKDLLRELNEGDCTHRPFGRGYRRWAGGVAPPARCAICSSDAEIRHQFLATRLWAKQSCQNKADRPEYRSDQHRYGEPSLPGYGEIGQNRRNQAAEDRALVVAETACCCAHLGRE